MPDSRRPFASSDVPPSPENLSSPRIRNADAEDSGRLGRRLVLWLGAVAVTTTLIAGAFVYVALFRRSVHEVKNDLARHAQARAYREGHVFREAGRVQAFLRRLILERLAEPIPADIEARFWKIARRDPDGAIRNAPVDAAGRPFDGRRQAGIFLNKNATLTPDLMRRIVLFAELCDAYGPSVRPLLCDLFIDTPENASLLYWPEAPNWSQRCPADFDQNAEAYEQAANARNNPSRRTVWTNVYYDPHALAWMMSCVTPVDIGGRQVATIGNDVRVSELIERFGQGALPGGSGMLVRRDGRLIVHPDETERLKALRGDYRITRDGTPAMKAVFAAILGSGEASGVVELPEYDLVAAYERLPEPDAYHVEFMPRSLLLAEANGGTLLFVFLLASVLVVQFGVLVAVLSSRVIRPILRLTESAARFTPAAFKPLDGVEGDDEISDLARSFNEMGRAVALQHRQIQGQASALEAEVRRRTAELESARDAAQAANLAKSEFLANVSHELRTPLNAMVGFAQLLADDTSLTPDQRRRVSGITHAGEHLLGLIHDTLDLSRMEVGEFALVFAPMDLDALVADVVSWVEPLCREKRLAFRCEVLDRAPGAFLADVVRVRQILINLLTNAVKYTPRGSVTLTVSMRRVRPDADSRLQLCFEVSDTGVGVPEARREAVFERCASAEDGGVSLGLAISRELARRMGGDIRVSDAPSGGAVFTFCFECDTATAASPAPEPEVAVAGRESGRAPRVPCLLLVDDVRANREVLRECLYELGYTDLHEADDGEEALARLAERHVDLVITDLSMPKLDGFGLRARMSEDIRWSRIPLIAVSAGMVDRHGRTALEAGFDAFLSKPYRIAALHEAVRKLVGEAPPRVAPAVAASEPATEVVAPAGPVVSPGVPRVLVVEDDAMIRQVLSEVLVALSFEPVAAADGVDALERLFRESFDLVLFDFSMPRMNGLEFVRRYRAEPELGRRGVTFVCVTGYLDDAQRRELESLGVRAVLEKPFRSSQLRDLVVRELGLSAAALTQPAA